MLDEDEDSKQEAYYQALREKIPEDFRDYDFNKLIHVSRPGSNYYGKTLVESPRRFIDYL